jgi:hypothetical protein
VQQLQTNIYAFLNKLLRLQYRKYLSFCLLQKRRPKKAPKKAPKWLRTLQLALHATELIQIVINHLLFATDTIQIEIIMPTFKKSL